MTTVLAEKKVTAATVKAFIRRNRERLMISVPTNFNGMVECVMQTGDTGFYNAESDGRSEDDRYTLGIRGVWFVGRSRDSFTRYSQDGFEGFKVYNCCGTWIVAVPSP